MGCKSSRDGCLCLHEDYQRRALPIPGPSTYQNEFEKEVYMMVNLIRADPKGMVPRLRKIK
jgi:hypothetical protein